MGGDPAPRHDGAGAERFVEYYETTVELSATVILRSARGWELLSAGRVGDSTFWAEYERVRPTHPDQMS